MTYFITDTNVVKINETSGVIQNFSNSKIDVSNNENFSDWLILAPLNKFSFNTQIYIRAHDNITQLIKVNVVPFVIDGSTPTSQSSGGNDTVADENVATDDDADELLDSIFGGLG